MIHLRRNLCLIGVFQGDFDWWGSAWSVRWDWTKHHNVACSNSSSGAPFGYSPVDPCSRLPATWNFVSIDAKHNRSHVIYRNSERSHVQQQVRFAILDRRQEDLAFPFAMPRPTHRIWNAVVPRQLGWPGRITFHPAGHPLNPAELVSHPSLMKFMSPSRLENHWGQPCSPKAAAIPDPLANKKSRQGRLGS